MPQGQNTASPPLVALAAWLLPGGGYLLLGQRTRGLVVGITIVVLFVFGLLIGGVRALEVPGYGPNGRPIQVWERVQGQRETGEQPPAGVADKWIMTSSPFLEIRDKPWSIAQVLAGPIALASMKWSTWAANPDNGADGVAPGVRSHARVNEIGVLYTAVAGMLNLLAIIDASHRAEQGRSGRAVAKPPAARPTG